MADSKIGFSTRVQTNDLLNSAIEAQESKPTTPVAAVGAAAELKDIATRDGETKAVKAGVLSQPGDIMEEVKVAMTSIYTALGSREPSAALARAIVNTFSPTHAAALRRHLRDTMEHIA